FAYIVVSAVVILAVLKYYKGRNLFYALELLLAFFTVQLFAALFIGDLNAVGVGVAAVALRLLLPQTKSLFLFFSSATVGALLGASLDPLPAVVLALLLAGYDYYAVFISKHMITMAKQLSKRNAGFSVTMQQDKETLELGTGDIVIPAMITVSALKISLHAAVAAFAGSLVGVLVLFYLLEMRRGYWPALPPLAGSSLVFLGGFLVLRMLGVGV
ncbi:MAG TPA: presenilin family intramembrane aspartyl protease, partial [Candidatus Norongarragalinales archaeon]|nr:presenilin family intramembrane aspartyl protease [Candidatus Norongarragalinales archaeon]